MNNFPTKSNPAWVDVPQLEQNMPVLAGEGHPSNWQARALAERTDYLYKLLQNIVVPESPKNGINGISVLSSNESSLLLANEDGVVTSYAFSGCDLQVLEGATPLVYDGLGNTAGRWKITAVGTNITPGVITPTSTGATVADHSGMPQLAMTARVEYTVIGQSLGGVPFVLPKMQTFIKVSSAEGNDGMSAYELAVLNGFVGTYQQWLDSLKGSNGKSAYELAVQAGFAGTYTEWLASLKGTNGTNGTDGTKSYARAITGNVWSDTEAIQAYRDWGHADPVLPVLGDTVTLFNVALKFSEMREYTSTGWKQVVSRIPGSAIMAQSITTEQLLVTGMGSALNADPNTVDISAWEGTGISIVADPSAPNGLSALRVTAEQSIVLSRAFPINASQDYRIRTWVRGTGVNTAYLIVSFLDANGNPLQGTTHKAGWPFSMLYHAYGLIYEEVPTIWTEYSASFGPHEDFGIPVGAKTMRVGIYANMDGPGIQYISGLNVRQKTDGSLLVDGSVRARHMITDGLIVYNENGEVVLDASGSNLPPWVVDLFSTPDTNSLSLVKPKDSSNRAAIRSISTDGKTMSIGVSPSGNSIVLSAKGTDFWRVVYKDPLTILVTDGLSRLDHSYLNLEPNKVYQIEVVLSMASVTGTSTASFFAKAPIGTTIQVNRGTTDTFTTASEKATGSWSVGIEGSAESVQSFNLLLVTGANGGPFNLYATAANQNFALKKGTSFSAREIEKYVTPISDAINVPATVVVPFSEAPYNRSVAQVATPSESYKEHLTLQFDAANRGPSSTGAISYMILVSGVPLPTLLVDEANDHLYLHHSVSSAYGWNCVLTNYDVIKNNDYLGYDEAYTAGFKALWLKNYTASERSRWTFSCTITKVSSTKWSNVFTDLPTGSKTYDVTGFLDLNGEYITTTEELMYSTSQTNPMTPFNVTFDYTVTAKRLGVTMGTFTYRITYNFF